MQQAAVKHPGFRCRKEVQLVLHSSGAITVTGRGEAHSEWFGAFLLVVLAHALWSLKSSLVHFAGSAFYRPESGLARDLAILVAAAYKKRIGHLKVLDVMAGSGMRGARYLQQVGPPYE